MSYFVPLLPGIITPYNVPFPLSPEHTPFSKSCHQSTIHRMTYCFSPGTRIFIEPEPEIEALQVAQTLNNLRDAEVDAILPLAIDDQFLQVR